MTGFNARDFLSRPRPPILPLDLVINPSTSNDTDQKPELIIFVGPPASGKTTFYNTHFATTRLFNLSTAYTQSLGFPDDWVNQDTLKDREKCVEAVRLALLSGKSVVVDNTNRSRETRGLYLSMAKKLGIAARCFVWRDTQVAW